MAVARMLVRGASYLVTRTTSDRRFLLKPGVVDGVFLYCLFRAAKAHGILLHQLTVMSTHFHLVLTDPREQLCEFMAWLDAHVANCLLAHYRHEYPKRTLEAIWSSGRFNATMLPTKTTIKDALVYSVTNPTKDGLVADFRQWPGICTRPGDWLKGAMTVERPKLYFNPRRREHREASGQFTIPPQFADKDPQAFVDEMYRRIADEMRAIHRSRAGKGYLGVKAILAADPFDSPTTPRVSGGLNPTFKSSGDAEVRALAAKVVRAFRESYYAALDRFRRGLHAVFPAGTQMMRKRFGVECEPDCFDWVCRAAASG